MSILSAPTTPLPPNPLIVGHSADAVTGMEANVADIVVFDPATIRNKATLQAPHQYSVGIANLIMNGTSVIDHDRHTGALAGKELSSRLTRG